MGELILNRLKCGGEGDGDEDETKVVGSGSSSGVWQ